MTNLHHYESYSWAAITMSGRVDSDVNTGDNNGIARSQVKHVKAIAPQQGVMNLKHEGHGRNRSHMGSGHENQAPMVIDSHLWIVINTGVMEVETHIKTTMPVEITISLP